MLRTSLWSDIKSTITKKNFTINYEDENMAKFFGDAGNYLHDLSTSAKMAHFTNELANEDNESNANIPEGLPKFLMNTYDKTKKLAIPVVLSGICAGGIAATHAVAAPVVAVIESSLGVGKTMTRSYKEMNTVEMESKPKSLSTPTMPFLETRFAKLDIPQDT